MNRTARVLILLGFLYCIHLVWSPAAAAQVLQVTPFGVPVGHTPLLAARNGRLYILDDYTNRLFICDTSGSILRTVGSIGDGPGQFYRPSAMAMTSRSIVVYDKGNRRIEVLSLDGAFQRDFAVHGDIFSIAAGDDGRVYVNDPSSGSLITVLSADGKIMKALGHYPASHRFTAHRIDHAMTNFAYRPTVYVWQLTSRSTSMRRSLSLP